MIWYTTTLIQRSKTNNNKYGNDIARRIIINMETIFELSDILGIIICVLPALLTAIAIIRIVIKTRRGGHIDVPPVGVMNDLPSSVTGINKHDDMRERATERASRR